MSQSGNVGGSVSGLTNPLEELFNLLDWAFFFDPNQGITTDGSGKVSEWVDAKNGISLPFSSGNRPDINTLASGAKEIVFTGSEFSDVININEEIGSVFFITKPDNIVSNVAPIINLYSGSIISLNNVTGNEVDEDFSLVLSNDVNNYEAYTSINGYDRSIWHSFSTRIGFSTKLYAIDGSVPTSLGFDPLRPPSGQTYANFRIGGRDVVAGSYTGSISYVLGTKGAISSDKFKEASKLLNKVRLQNYI